MAAFESVGIGAAMEETPMTVYVTGWLENAGVLKEHSIASRFPAAERLSVEHEKNF